MKKEERFRFHCSKHPAFSICITLSEIVDVLDYIFTVLHFSLYGCIEISKWSMWLLLLSSHFVVFDADVAVAVMQKLQCRSLQNYWHKFSGVSLSETHNWGREWEKHWIHWSANILEIGGNGTCVNVCALSFELRGW